MLTTQAFNALLKTLEEPPKHVIFILATTEYYKIPLTITSRCQKFQFNKISDEDIVLRLREIANLEKIVISDDALNEIAKISDGGMRDSINFLDQLRSFTSKNIEINDVYDVCGNVSIREMVELFTNIKSNEYEKVTSFFEYMDNLGKNYGKFLENVVEFLKDIILYKKNVNHRYIKSDISSIKSITALYNDDEIFIIIEFINNLISELRFVSRQSVVVITNFLILMNKLSNKYENIEKKSVNNVSVNIKEKNDVDNYDMAFQFTSNDDDKQDDSNVDNLTNDNKIIDDKDDNLTNRNNQNKDIIVNNAFAVADKNIKNNLQKSMSKFGDYLTDKKFKSVAGLFVDVKLEVAGEEYIIFSAMNEAVVKNISDNYKLCNELLDLIFTKHYNFVVLNNNEWNSYRDEYVANFKAGKKYVLKELLTEEITLVDDKKEPTIVDKLFDLVGEDYVEFK